MSWTLREVAGDIPGGRSALLELLRPRLSLRWHGQIPGRLVMFILKLAQRRLGLSRMQAELRVGFLGGNPLLWGECWQFGRLGSVGFGLSKEVKIRSSFGVKLCSGKVAFGWRAWRCRQLRSWTTCLSIPFDCHDQNSKSWCFLPSLCSQLHFMMRNSSVFLPAYQRRLNPLCWPWTLPSLTHSAQGFLDQLKATGSLTDLHPESNLEVLLKHSLA